MIWQKLTITTRLTICGLIHLTSGGNISIQKPGNQTGEKPYECGRNVTLTCKFKKNTFAIVWMKATDIKPIAKCTQNNCFLTSENNGQYTFTYDIQGIFNLTVIEITKEDNGRKLICSDGSDSDYEVIQVSDYEPLLFEDTINGTVRAISGCISQDIEVSFKWIKVSVSSGIEEEIIPTIHDDYTRNCSNDSDCGYDQQVQYSEMISAKSSDNGKYVLKVLAVFGNESKESCNTAYKYMIEEHDNKRTNNETVIGFVVTGGFLGVSIAILLLWKCRKRRRKEEEEFYQQKLSEQYTQKKLNEKRDTSTKPTRRFMNEKVKRAKRNHRPSEKRRTPTDTILSKNLFDRRHRRRRRHPKDGLK